MRAMLTAAAMMLAVLLTASPAHAVSTKPLIQEPGDRGQHTVVLVAPWNGHGVRPVARYVDRRVGGLVIEERRGADCRASVTCIRIQVRNFGRRVWCGGVSESITGCAQLGGRDPFAKINTRWVGADRATMCHELLHTLGLRHHDRPGCVGRGARNPSRVEVAALRRLF